MHAALLGRSWSEGDQAVSVYVGSPRALSAAAPHGRTQQIDRFVMRSLTSSDKPRSRVNSQLCYADVSLVSGAIWPSGRPATAQESGVIGRVRNGESNSALYGGEAFTAMAISPPPGRDRLALGDGRGKITVLLTARWPIELYCTQSFAVKCAVHGRNRFSTVHRAGFAVWSLAFNPRRHNELLAGTSDCRSFNATTSQDGRTEFWSDVAGAVYSCLHLLPTFWLLRQHFDYLPVKLKCGWRQFARA